MTAPRPTPRKRRRGKRRTVHVQLLLTSAEQQSFDVAASVLGYTRSAFIRQCVRRYLTTVDIDQLAFAKDKLLAESDR